MTEQAETYYQFTTKRMLTMFSWSFVYLLLPLIVNLFLPSDSKMPLGLLLIAEAFCFMFAIPGIMISNNYFKMNGDLSLHFKKGEDRFIVTKGKERHLFDKKDVHMIYRTLGNSNQAPWSGYEYSVLWFKNGSRLWLSNILISSEELDNHIDEVGLVLEKEWIPLLRNSLLIRSESPG